MHDSISISDGAQHGRTSAVRLIAANGRRPSLLVPGARVLALLDSLTAAFAIVVVLISVNLPHMPAGLDSFLSARVSVKNILLLLFLGSAWPVLFYLFGLYEARRVEKPESEAGRLLAATTVGIALVSVFPLSSASGALAVGHLKHFWFLALVLGLSLRTGRRAIDSARNRHARRTLIVGTGRLARRAYRDLRNRGARRYEVVGFIDVPNGDGPHYDRVPEETIGTPEHLEHILMRQVIDEVIVALPVKSCYQQIQHVIGVCERAGVEAKYAADLFDSTVAFPRYDADGERAFVAMQVAPDGHRMVIKRGIDIAGAAVGLLLLSPLLLIVAAAIKLTSRGPVIYAQDRCGHNKRPLRMYKFRSMFAEADQLQSSLEDRNEARGPVFKIRDDPRITPVGRFLRKSSLDELPQLWNVLLGDMSLVGPRPLPWRDVGRIIRPSDMRRFSMRPGLTCLWQIQGRSNLDFERWVELDLQYIDNWSLRLDMQILVKTIPAVLSANGAT